jgi:hypothetical protein
MNVLDLASSREGTFAGVMEVPWPWPVKLTGLLFSQELEDGRLLIAAHNDGKISAKLVERASSKVLLDTMSCALWAQEPCATSIIVTWELDNLEIRLNNNLVASVLNEADIPDEYRFPPNKPSGPSFDFSKENAEAIRHRHAKLMGHGGTPIPQADIAPTRMRFLKRYETKLCNSTIYWS